MLLGQARLQTCMTYISVAGLATSAGGNTATCSAACNCKTAANLSPAPPARASLWEQPGRYCVQSSGTIYYGIFIHAL